MDQASSTPIESEIICDGGAFRVVGAPQMQAVTTSSRRPDRAQQDQDPGGDHSPSSSPRSSQPERTCASDRYAAREEDSVL
jgi:hypothetical protein